MRQWMLRITKYADKLLAGLDTIDWPEATKKRQREWIGRSEGAHIDFTVQAAPVAEGETARVFTIRVFTTRPDTLWGATYMVLAPEHSLVDKIATAEQRDAVATYRKQVSARSDVDRQEGKEKTGVFTGAYALNPATEQAIPVWIADYVLMGYGTGAIMAVPAHDERDYAFAKAMQLPITQVVSGGDISKEAHTGDGVLMHSGELDGAKTEGRAAVRQAIALVEKLGVGEGAITYRLRDWVFARQRYWGEPIPILKRGKEVARVLRENELPLELPRVKNYAPSGSGSPLLTVPEWVNVQEGGETVQRETDTMPGSAGSSWYFLRYADPHNDREPFTFEKQKYWMPVDLYVGGNEHAVLHLLYARFWHKVLFDAGLVSTKEPFQRLFHQGMIHKTSFRDAAGKYYYDHEVVERDGRWVTKDGLPVETKLDKMSKSRYNVVNPDDMGNEYGADAMRMYELFMGPLEDGVEWETAGVSGTRRFLDRVWRLLVVPSDPQDPSTVDVLGTKVRDDAPTTNKDLERALHAAIKKVTAAVTDLKFNTAISEMMVFVNEATRADAIPRPWFEMFVKILSPFAPHLAEEVWQRLGHTTTITYEPWPVHDEAKLLRDTIKIGVQVMGKLRSEIEVPADATQEAVIAMAKVDEKVQPFLAGKEIKREVYVKGRLVNLVVG